jgi:transcriptional regulator with XRE-family HTH domain
MPVVSTTLGEDQIDMSIGPGPMVTRRRLRAELRKLRLAKGHSIEFVANEVEWSTSKLIRIENGQVAISKSDLTALLTLYEVRDQKYADELQDLARTSRQRMWWSQYQRYLHPTLVEYIGAEADASRIFNVQPLVVPGLLQTAAYAAAINEATQLSAAPEDQVKARVDVRIHRQTELFDRRDDVSIFAIMDEAALRRPVGGPSVMREQLDHLLSLEKRRDVNVVVIPFAAGPHPGMDGPFSLLEYDDPQDDDVVFLENAAGGLVVRDQKETVAMYRRAVDRMIDAGVRDKAAIDFIAAIRREFV